MPVASTPRPDSREVRAHVDGGARGTWLAVAALAALAAAALAAGCGRESPTAPTWLTEARVAFWRDYQRGPAKIDIYLDDWFVGTLHLSRLRPPDCEHVNEHVQSTWFDVITAERPPGTYAIRGVGFDESPGDPSTIEWASTARLDRGCTSYRFHCGDDRDCQR